MDWVSQSSVLDRADLMINHGGIGTVKECLAKGVPMIVFPLMRDQFSCAEWLKELHLCLCGDAKTISPEQIETLIYNVLDEGSVRLAAKRMARRVRQMGSGRAVNFIEKAYRIS